MILRECFGLQFSLTLAFVLTQKVATSSPAKDAFANEEIRDIEKFVGDVMGCANIPGLAVGVVRGETTFSAGFGVANMATGQPVDKGTIFNLGSTAKAFVPYILAELMNGKENQDKRLTWNSTLNEILGNDLDIELPQPWANITLKDMLVYKSGSSAADMATMVGLPNQVSREEILRRLRFLPDSNEFRISNHFSNIMYTVAGHLAERMSKMSWEELVKAMVLDRQSMNASSFAPEGMTGEDSAHPYWFHPSKPKEPFVEQNASLFDLHPFLPVGSLMASAEDVTKWLRHLLHNVHAKGNDSGINAFIGDAFQHWVSVPGDHHDGALFHDSEVALGYGMGWYSSTYRGLKRLKFSGRLYAYSSQIWLFPDSMSAVFVAMNGPGTDRGQRALEGIMYHISDITLQKPAWMVTDKACCCLNEDYDHDDLKDETAPGEFKLVKYLSPVENYIGDYGNGLVGNLNIEPNKSGILILKLGRNLMGELTPGVTESKLKFSVTSPLENTEEWCDEKTIEFLLSRPHAEGVGHSELYDKVRIYIKDHLFYEFNRGKAFEAMLSLAEEEDRKLREEAETLLINNSHNEERSKNASNVYETEYPYEEDNDSVKDGGHNHEANHSVQDSHQLPDASSPDIGEDEIKSGASGPIDTAKEVSHDGHQSHKFLSVEGQGDEPVKEDAKDLAKTTESGQKERDKQDPTSNPGNACSSFNPFPVFIFIMLLLNSCF